MHDITTTLTVTAAELRDLRAAVRAHRRTIDAAAERGETLGMQATRLALLAPRLTDALDRLDALEVATL